MKKSFLATPLALAALAACSAVSAQTTSSAAELDRVVVSAARAPQKLSDVLADVTVLTRADIERQGYGDLSDVLRASGTVQLVRNGGPGTTTSLYLRGNDSQHTLVMIDGVRIDSMSGSGGAPWETIPLSQIDHIEIIKGPASAMYGSDAIGGVVQIFTIKGKGAPKLDMGLSKGSLGTARGDASLSGSSGIFDYALSGATEHSDGFRLVPNPNDPSYNYNPDPAGYQKHSWSARLGAQLDAQDRLEFIDLSSHLNAAFNDYSATALGQQLEDTRADKLSWQRQWNPDLHTQLSYGESTAVNNDVTDFYLSKTRIRSTSLEGNWRVASGQQVLFAVDHKGDSLDSSDLPASSGQRHEDGASLGYLWQSGAMDLQAHVRRDRDSEFGSADTGSLGLGYKIGTGVKLVASAGNAFRAPTLYQNASVYGPLSLAGGQSLRPETGHSAEIGLKFDGADASGAITAYRNSVDNLINFQTATTCLVNSYGCYVNIGQARLQGVSAEGRLQTGSVEWSGTLDFEDPKDLSTNKLLARRARQFGTLSVQTPFLGWDLGSTLLFSAKRYNDAANTVLLGGYALFSLDASYKLTHELKLQLNLDNAFNRVYQTAAGYAQPPRTVMVGLRYTPSL